MTPIRNIMGYPGVDPTGATDSTAAINAVLALGGPVYVPSNGGTASYQASGGLVIPSGTHLFGDGSGSRIFSLSSSVPLITNADPASGDSDIEIDHLKLQMPVTSAFSNHVVYLENVARHRVHENWVYGGGSGIASVGCTDYWVMANRIEQFNNAGVDNWCHSSTVGPLRGTIGWNHIIGAGNSPYGVLVTGMTTALTAGIAQEIDVILNQIYNVTQLGIWLQGGTTGVCAFCKAIMNTIDGVTQYHGIRASEGYGHVFALNALRNIVGSGFVFQGETTTGGAHDCAIEGNLLDKIGTGGGASFDFTFGNGASNHVIADNKATNGTPPNCVDVALAFAAGANNNDAHGNILAPGVYGIISDSGTGNRYSDNPGYNPVGHFGSQPTVPASPSVYTNAFGVRCRVYVGAGTSTITAISINGTATGLISGEFILDPGETIAITYSGGTPVWSWFGL
jgi:hypothetical protein